MKECGASSGAMPSDVGKILGLSYPSFESRNSLTSLRNCSKSTVHVMATLFPCGRRRRIALKKDALSFFSAASPSPKIFFISVPVWAEISEHPKRNVSGCVK